MANDRTAENETPRADESVEPYEPPTLEPLGSVHATTLQTGPIG